MRRPMIVVSAGLTGLVVSACLRRRGVPHRLIDPAPRRIDLAVWHDEAGYRMSLANHRAVSVETRGEDGLLRTIEDVRRATVIRGVAAGYPMLAELSSLPKAELFACVRDFSELASVEGNPEVGADLAGPPGPHARGEAGDDLQTTLRLRFGAAITEELLVPLLEGRFGRPAKTLDPSLSSALWRPSRRQLWAGALGLSEPETLTWSSFDPDALASAANPVEWETAPLAIDLSTKTLRTQAGDTEFLHLFWCAPELDLGPIIGGAPSDPEVSLRCAVALNHGALTGLDILDVVDQRSPFWRVHVLRRGCPPGKSALLLEVKSRRHFGLDSGFPDFAALVEPLVRCGLVRGADSIRFFRWSTTSSWRPPKRLPEVVSFLDDSAFLEGDEPAQSVEAARQRVDLVLARW